MKKIVFITSHLSTGGMPQYLLWNIEQIIKQYEVYVIEYNFLSPDYIVQRNRIQALIPKDNFFTLLENKEEILSIINKISPDILHFTEITETFCDIEIAKKIYHVNRPYLIIESTHSSIYNTDDKQLLPDQFLFVSKFNETVFKKFKVPIDIIEYEIQKECISTELNLNQDRKHVLNVGLFTPGKNQGQIFEIARKMPEVDFHFIGNLAPNFKEYWEPLLKDRPSNCHIHGEMSNVATWYKECDLFLFTSNKELNPICIKEAEYYHIPILMKNLPTYLNKYKGPFITDDDDFNIKLIREKLYSNEFIKIYNNLKKRPAQDRIKIDFVDGATALVQSDDYERKFDVEFIEAENSSIIYSTTLHTHHFAKTTAKYFKNYRVKVKNSLTGEILEDHLFNASGKSVHVCLDSRALGDTLAWMPYVEEFRKKHGCHLYCSTFYNEYLKDVFPDINFISPSQYVENAYAKYMLGLYFENSFNYHPVNPRIVPLQKMASDILGLEFEELPLKFMRVNKPSPLSKKYICIGTESTAQAKLWNNENGWQQVVNYFHFLGYTIVSLKRSGTSGLQNVIEISDSALDEAMLYIQHCLVFIGLGSGLSWLAHAYKKPVILISGFSKDWCEFSTPYRIINPYVCHGCFNDEKHTFDRSDWNWCPKNKNFECTKSISSQTVIETTLKAIKENNS